MKDVGKILKSSGRNGAFRLRPEKSVIVYLILFRRGSGLRKRLLIRYSLTSLVVSTVRILRNIFYIERTVVHIL